ncbi:MAG: anti-sigma factor [Magnetospirillum gryphiswaldense]|nr:anti-sigma factor [Magnetospirillum gryphiswaldense]
MSERLGDDELHAYVDGLLDQDGNDRVEAWLADNPDQAERVRLWQEHNDGLRRLFDPVLDEPIPAPLLPAAIRSRIWRNRRLLALRVAAALALVLAGGGGGWWLRGQSSTEAQVAREALAAHVVYVADQRRPVEVPGSERDQMATWLSKRLGAKMAVPDLSASGYQLVGGRLLAAENGAAALYMYENSLGQRLTLYVRRAADDGRKDLLFQGRDGTLAGVWTQGPFGCALSGPLPREDLEPLARLVWKQMGTARTS